MTFYDWYWPLCWLGLSFLMPELVAWFLGRFRKKPGNTFSEWTWRVFALIPGTPQRFKFLRRWAFGCFWASLGLHLIFQASVWALIIYTLPAAACVVYHYRYERGHR